jgi:predicted dehydrogenase
MTRLTPTIAVLGQGSIGRRHARLLVAEGCEVVAWDPQPPAEKVAGVRRADSAEAALAAAAAAVVASPSVHHLEQAQLAIDHGCHVLVEKPVAASADGVQALIHRAERAGRVLAVGMNLRFHPGIALDAIHEVDYATWALGEARDVSAWLGRVSELELDVEDVALLIVRHVSGAVCTVTLDYLDRRYRRGCRVVGSEGSVEWRWEDERVRVLTADDERSVPAPADVGPTYRDQARAFLAAVARGRLDGDSPLAGARAGLHAVRVVDAARASSADGRRVALVP